MAGKVVADVMSQGRVRRTYSAYVATAPEEVVELVVEPQGNAFPLTLAIPFPIQCTAGGDNTDERPSVVMVYRIPTVDRPKP